MFIQQLASGLSVGSACTLMAVGYAPIYSLMNFTNFIHSITVTIGAFTTSFSLTYAMQDLLAEIITGIIAVTLLAVMIEFVACRPLLRRSARRVYLMIIGLRISMMGDNLIIIALSDRFRILPMNFPSESIRIMGANMGLVSMPIFSASMISPLVVKLIIHKAKLGLTIRSATSSLGAISLTGVDTSRLILSILLIAGSPANAAGTPLGAKHMAYPSLGTLYANKAFTCAVFGELGSPPGAVVGALVPGVLKTMISAYVSTSLRGLPMYFLLVMILLIRPSGPMGKPSKGRI